MSESEKTVQTPAQPIVVAVPTPAQQPRQTAERRPAKPRRPSWWSKPPVLVAGLLSIVVVELATYAGLGVTGWLVVNAVLALITAVAVFLLRRRAARAGVDRQARRLVAAANRIGGLAGRARGLVGRRSAGGSGSQAAGGLRSRLFGGSARKAAQSGGAARAGGSPVRRLLAGLRRPGRGGATRAAGGATTPGGSTSGGGLRGLLGRARARGAAGSRGASAAGGGAAPGRRGGVLGRLWGRAMGGGSSAGSTGGKRAGGAAKTRSSTSAKRSPTWWNPFTWRGWTPSSNTKATPESKALAKEIYGKQASADDPSKREPRQRPTNSTGGKPEPTDRRAPLPVPARPRHSSGGSPMSSPMKHSDDASLQRWGANLSGAHEAAEEVRKLYAKAAAAAEQFRTVFGKIAQQGETELPVSHRVMADIDSITTRSKRATTPEEWATVVADCGVLPSRYRSEHETDEDRLNAPRKSLAAEKRADVTAAEQDN